MTAYLVGALVALVAAAVCGWLAQQAKNRKASLLLTETSTTGLLRDLLAAATAAAGPGSFSEYVELQGTAQAGPAGLLTSEISETPCVWHRHEITRKYREVERDSEGNRRTVTKTETIAQHSSEDAFLLRDADGEITIVPSCDVEHPRKSVSEFRQEKDRDRTDVSFGKFSFSLPSGDRDTIGYEYEEWLLAPGTRIFVQGEAYDRNGDLEVREPKGKRDLVISTKSEEALIDDASGEIKLYGALAVLGAVAAVVLVVLAFVLG